MAGERDQTKRVSMMELREFVMRECELKVDLVLRYVYRSILLCVVPEAKQPPLDQASNSVGRT